ncbi:hypothetical protein A6V39_04405 [Candidatus Mycoplasma haematobovis]|uniref:Uncharacterized protein n=1 Tax=Candidatus Mycoplasma haematobovis TaxID=432608 RepID=A0A1A9QDV2_9MOLU|nr:hypothetical protein [Candidatus Mycoplasma haematobovis]OAL10126.1 hypothetical protein A6V39_04405 [Candidatus Mycoplasma haematobovis]
MSIFFLYASFIGCALGANSNPSVAAGCFIPCFIIYLVTYWKTHTRSALLRRTFQDYAQVKDIPMLEPNYTTLNFLLNVFIWLDIFLWPVMFPMKFIFWIYYRKFKKRVKQLRRMVATGEFELEDDDITEDPFYEFLLTEGLYEKPKITAATVAETLTGKTKKKIETLGPQKDTEEEEQKMKETFQQLKESDD